MNVAGPLQYRPLSVLFRVVGLPGGDRHGIDPAIVGQDDAIGLDVRKPSQGFQPFKADQIIHIIFVDHR